jgi:3-hydroxy-9,10-secoandrosta-1,3,5(10)-triene-9,17-dione monooxygenase reductase component
MADEVQAYKQAMGQMATAVSIVTTTDGVNRYGMTASAVCSLSLQPLLLLVCIADHLATHDAILRTGTFAVNVLPAGSEAIALQFARPSNDKFEGIELTEAEGPPLLKKAIATFTCDVHDVLPGGDHSIIVGAPKSYSGWGGNNPLVHFGGQFGTFCPV